ncbi:MAG: hypothetical protein ACYSTZ_05390, partial [Planctomycetota bacterium]
GRVDISCEQVSDTNEIIVSYDATSEANLVRAIALDIQLTGNGIIRDVKCTNSDFWLSPGKARDKVDPVRRTIDYDEPNRACVCPPPGPPPGTHPDTLPGIDSNGVTIEMGTLYEDGEPARSAELLRLYVEGSCFDIQMSENKIRGGVVMEDADQVVDVNTTSLGVRFGCFPCEHPEYDEWVALGKPECSCCCRFCYGDADCLAETKGNFWVYVNDLAILLSGWGKPYPDVGSDICADFDLLAETKGNFRVYVNDLTILLEHWGTPDVPCDCLDVP